MESYESCNLAEVFLPNVESSEELKDILALLYKTCKAITGMPYIHKKSEEVIHRNRRIGIGITGFLQATDKRDWLDPAYLYLRQYDKQYSKDNGVPESIKLTTVKPSGTLSILAGVTPGVHPAFAEYYIRRIRMASDDSLIKYCKDAGYPIEYARNYDGSVDHSTSIVSFPCTSQNAVLAKELTAIEQLEYCKELQSIWSDSSVSVTCYYRLEELPDIQEWLRNNLSNSLKSVSFLLHSEHGFDQAPYEEISQSEYYKALDNITKSTYSTMQATSDILDGLECEGGSCPIR